MAGDIDKDDRNMFRQLLIVDAIRGHHSTGVASATPKKGEMLVFKKALNPVDFMQLRGFDQVVDWNSQVLMGHNRYATVGKINNAGAHPFEHDGVVGAHNGTLERWFSLPESKEFTVDSECLIWNIANHGFQETMKKVEGAYALTVYDENNHQLHILRNKERPLYFGYKEDRSVLYWASEAWMIRNMAARCGIKLQKSIQQPKEHSLITWDLPKVKNAKMPEPKHLKLQGCKEKKYYPQRIAASRPYVAPNTPPIRGTGTSGQAGASNSRSNFTPYHGAPKIDGIAIGNRVAFCPVSICTSSNTNAKYLEGILVEEPWSEVRLYCNQPVVFEDLLAEELVCDVDVAAISSIGGPGAEAFIVANTASLTQRKEKASIKGDAPLDTDETKEVVMYAGPQGRMIDEDRWNQLIKHGCGYCTSDIKEDDVIEWVGQAPICTECIRVAS